MTRSVFSHQVAHVLSHLLLQVRGASSDEDEDYPTPMFHGEFEEVHMVPYSAELYLAGVRPRVFTTAESENGEDSSSEDDSSQCSSSDDGDDDEADYVSHLFYVTCLQN